MTDQQERFEVLVTGPHKRMRYGWWGTRLQCWLAGLKAHYRTAARASIPPHIRGVIIGGGDDIEPAHYGLSSQTERNYDPERDAFEMHMVRCALDSDIPLLGICRGAQLINVVLGGNLHADIRHARRHTPNRYTAFPVKSAMVVPNSNLHGYLGKDTVRINSLHNQAVKEVGEGLKVVARDEDTFVQAIEHDDRRFVVGVQWHPEYLPYKAAQRRLFSHFAEAVRATRSQLHEVSRRHSPQEFARE